MKKYPPWLCHKEDQLAMEFMLLEGKRQIGFLKAHASANSTRYETYLASNPMKIGKYEWRVIVYESQYYGRCTDYEWRMSKEGAWLSMTDWPHYDSHDGEYSGCPKTLKKLYAKNLGKVENALEEVKEDGKKRLLE